MTMRSIKLLPLHRHCALALIALSTLGLVTVVAQQRVSQRSSGPGHVQNQSVRYGGGALLPSEQRYVNMRSGLMPSEHRNLRWSSGSMPSQGRIAPRPGGNASLRYPTYNKYYNRTTNSMAPAFNTYTDHGGGASLRYRRPGSSSSIPDSSFRVNSRVNTRVTGSYSFHQNYNSYHQVTKPRSLHQRTPSLRYGGKRR